MNKACYICGTKGPVEVGESGVPLCYSCSPPIVLSKVAPVPVLSHEDKEVSSVATGLTKEIIKTKVDDWLQRQCSNQVFDFIYSIISKTDVLLVGEI